MIEQLARIREIKNSFKNNKNFINFRSEKLFFVVLTIVVVAAFVILRPSHSFEDSDTYWHIALGQAMITQKHVVTQAINVFSSTPLAYAPHEVGFQILVAFFYSLWGWKSIYLLTITCLGLVIWALYRLTQVSRCEAGLTPNHSFMLIFNVFTVVLIYFLYFTTRPQMLSLPVIIWYVIWLRRFQMKPTPQKATFLGILSLLLSNIHSGVWPLIWVFLIMALIEGFFEKRLSRWHLLAAFLITGGGLVNPGGADTILYLFHIYNYTQLVSEWKPIAFTGAGIAFFANLVIFIASACCSLRSGIFRKIFFLGILYLGVANYKEHLYLIAFTPYFTAVAVDHLRLPLFEKVTFSPKYFASIISIGLTLNLLVNFIAPYRPPVTKLPVEEISYIFNHFSGENPRILAPYAASGYIVFRGGNVLADGRFDPFILPESKGLNGWTALERSAYAFSTDALWDIIQYDKPDFLLIPLTMNDSIEKGYSKIAMQNIRTKLGKPIFSGPYGDVWFFGN